MWTFLGSTVLALVVLDMLCKLMPPRRRFRVEDLDPIEGYRPVSGTEYDQSGVSAGRTRAWNRI